MHRFLQTNCYLLPEGEYGVFDVSSAANAGTGDIFICSERSAKNMSYQGLAVSHVCCICRSGFSSGNARVTTSSIALAHPRPRTRVSIASSGRPYLPFRRIALC